MSQSATPIRVVFALYEGVQLLDVAGAAEVLALTAACNGGVGYEIEYVAPSAAPLASSAGLFLLASAPPRARRNIHTLVVPGAPLPQVEQALAHTELMGWLRRTARRAARVASVCTGAFLLGELGLLDGRRVTTHWAATRRLARMTPRAKVDPEALYVEDGRIWTSAGVATGMDLALALVARDFGPGVALEVARRLVLHLVRPGGQSQFSAPLSLQTRANGGLAELVAFVEARLPQHISVPQIAAALGKSERSLHRQCRTHFGMSPSQVVTELRLERARTLLNEPGLRLASVAARAGFADAPTFSKAFSKRFGASPSAYRRSFAGPGAGP